MSENKHVYELIGVDSFNTKILNETLWDIKEMMFHNLYDAQRSLTDMLRFDFNMSDFSTSSNTEFVYNINSQFIVNDARKTYRTSSFYKKDLTLEDINGNPDIFYNNILLFINGELYTNFFIRPKENITSIVFKVFSSFPTTAQYIRNGFTKGEMQDFIDTGAKMTVLFVKSHNQSNYKLNRLTLNNYALVERYLGLQMVNFTEVNDITTTGQFSCWVTNDDHRLYKYRLLTTELRNDNKLYFNATEIRSLTSTYTYLKNIYLLNHMDMMNISGITEYFELPIRDMPIPLENIMIFRKTNNVLLFDHETTLTLHYPNIYKINKNHTDDLLLYIYYADDTVSVGSKYENELALYYRFNQNILDQYRNDTIIEKVKNYNPITITYDNNDLKASNLDHLEYKMDKLNSMIRKNGSYYSIYLNKLIGYVPTFLIDVSQIDNLGERYRVNNMNEITELGNQITFNEPCYLFTFRHDSNNDKINISIDDYQTNELYVYYDEKYTYVYIPTRLVNTDSLIQVEKFVDYRYNQQITITNNIDYHKLNINPDQKIQMSDIYVSVRAGNGDEVYLSKDNYKIYIYRNRAYEEITNNDFYDYKDVYIQFTNPEDLNRIASVNVTRITFKQVVKGTNTIIINRAINNDKRNILVYKNGRLVPQQVRQYKFSEKVSGPHQIKGLLSFNFDDEYTLIYNTNKYFLVYFQETINTKGIVNLTGKINKPIDLKWYDLYLNGLKLDESNVEVLAPYIIKITGVPTTKNLEVYQKNLDSLTWNNNYPTDDIGSEIFDDIIRDIERDTEDLEDTLNDMLDDKIIDAIGFFDDYLFTTIRLINPDIQQITQEMIDLYPTVVDANSIFFINPDEQLALEKEMYLQPDHNTILVE